MAKRQRNSTSALKPLVRMTGDDAELRELIIEESFNAEVASLIYTIRTRAGLTQKQLADLIGTQQPVIAKLEDADYQGHSLSMIRRIADALNHRLEIRMIPKQDPNLQIV